MNSNKHKGMLIRMLLVIMMTVIVVVSFYPIIWMVTNSMRTTQEIFLNPLGVPYNIDFGIFASAWERADFTTALTNSVFITFVSVSINVIVSSLAAFSFAFLRLKGKDTLFLLILGGQIVSGQIILIPLFIMFRDLGLLDTSWSVILAYVAGGIPLSTILFNNAFKEVPMELFESSKMDGSSELRFFAQILIPLSKPIIASVMIFQSLFAWNEYLFALSFLRSPENRTIQTAIPVFFAQWTIDYASLFAILSIAIVPILILYLVLQKYFIKGMTAAAVKG